MKKVLHISKVLPLPKEITIKYNERDNDYLITLSDKLNVFSFSFIKPSIKVSRIISSFSKKWQVYRNLPSQYNIDKYEVEVFKITLLPKRILYNFLSVLSLCKFKKKLNLFSENDLIHAQYIFQGGLYAHYLYKKYRIPYIITLREEDLYAFKGLYKKRALSIIQDAYEINCPSYNDKIKLEKLISKKIDLIPHGINEEDLYFDLSTNNTIVINVVSRLLKWKKIDVILEALSGIAKEKYVLNIIGDGEYKEELLSKAKSFSINYIYKGYMNNSDVLNELRSGDLFILPSDKETFGRVYIEALATSNAVVGIKNAGVYGYFNDDEMIFVEPDKVEELRNTIIDLLNNKEKIIMYKNNGYNAVKHRFTWKAIANLYEQIYRGAMKNGK